MLCVRQTSDTIPLQSLRFRISFRDQAAKDIKGQRQAERTVRERSERTERDKRDRKETERHRGDRDRETQNHRKRTTIDRGKITRDRDREARGGQRIRRDREIPGKRDPLLAAGATHT